MKKSENKTIVKTLGLPVILTLIFMVLKLCHVISWSWWLVMLPVLIDVVVGGLIWIIVLIILMKGGF